MNSGSNNSKMLTVITVLFLIAGDAVKTWGESLPKKKIIHNIIITIKKNSLTLRTFQLTYTRRFFFYVYLIVIKKIYHIILIHRKKKIYSEYFLINVKNIRGHIGWKVIIL